MDKLRFRNLSRGLHSISPALLSLYFERCTRFQLNQSYSGSLALELPRSWSALGDVPYGGDHADDNLGQ
jgi:hypothetical protein